MDRTLLTWFIALFTFWPTLVHAKVYRPIKTDDSFFVQNARDNQIKVMSFNAHNLYDTTHDRGYFDYTFLPKSHPDKYQECKTLNSPYYRRLCINLDWTPYRLKKKIKQISQVLLRHGSLPDILALQEIENENVVSMLADRMGYDQFQVTNEKSKRGQDVALLWLDDKVEYLGKKHIETRLRDILRVQFRIRGANDIFYIYVNHWPAQSAPRHWRINTAWKVRADIDKVRGQNPHAKIMLVGDFNVTAKEERRIFDRILFDNDWTNRLVDVHKESRQLFPKHHQYFPKGTYWRGGSANAWQRFDRILVSENFIVDNTRAELRSYRLVYSTFLTAKARFRRRRAKGEVEIRYPLSYNFLEEGGRPLGYSDHLPVSVMISY